METPAEIVEWERQAGRLILAFGSLEHAMIELYRLFLPARNYDKDDFDDRFDKLIGALKQRNRSDAAIEALVSLRQLSDTRHLLAHNPIYFDFFVHIPTGELVFENSITDRRRDQRITLDQLQNQAATASDAVKVVYSEFGTEMWAGT